MTKDMIKKKHEDRLIQRNQNDINIVDAHKLIEMTVVKKDLMFMIKFYSKKVFIKMNASGKEDQIACFKQAKQNQSNFLQVNTPNMEETGPTFLFFNDGVKYEES